MLLQIAVFHSFLRLIFHCLCMYHICFIHFSVSGHLSRFHVLAIINSAAMNSAWAMYLFKLQFSLDV